MTSDDVSAETSKAAATGNNEDAAGRFAEAVGIMARLRGPDGCPWDREQTPASIRKYTLEETYEVLDAIDRGHTSDLCEELGDLLLQVLFYAQMAAEQDQFTIGDVVAGLNQKLIRRHPHVFGEAAAAAAGNSATVELEGGRIAVDQVLRNWNAIKRLEKKDESQDQGSRPSRLAGVLRSQPALMEAQKLGSVASRCGFDWPDALGLLAKIREETDEVEAEMAAGQPPTAALQLEVGDLLFMITNLARHLKVDPELALRDANAKFRSRFVSMESSEQQDGGVPLEDRSLDELEALWQHAKQLEQAGANREPVS